MQDRTDHEADVLRELIIHGLPVRKAAQRLGIDERSAHARIGQIYGGVRVLRRDGSVFQVRSARQVAELLGRRHEQVTAWLHQGLFDDDIGGRVQRNIGSGTLSRRRGRAKNQQWLVTDYALIMFLQNPQTWMLWHPDQITDPDWQAYAREIRPGAGGEWICLTDVASRLGWPERTLRRLASVGVFPAVRQDKKWWFWRGDVEEALAGDTENKYGACRFLDRRRGWQGR